MNWLWFCLSNNCSSSFLNQNLLVAVFKMCFLVFILLFKSNQSYLYSSVSQITNVPQGALQCVQSSVQYNIFCSEYGKTPTKMCKGLKKKNRKRSRLSSTWKRCCVYRIDKKSKKNYRNKYCMDKQDDSYSSI